MTDSLPPELLKELTPKTRKRLLGIGERAAITARLREGDANVDELLIAVYRRENVIMQRSRIVSLLYRMQLAGEIEALHHQKKGWYRLKERK